MGKQSSMIQGGAILVAIVLFPATSLRASDELRQELSVVAEMMAKLVEARGGEAIAVGQFTGPSHMPSSAGPLIVKTLTEELEKMKVSVKRRANLEIKGDYLDVEDKASKKLAVMLKGRVIDRTGTIVTEFQRGIFGESTIAAMFGLTTTLPANGDDKARDDKLRESIDKPKATFADTKITAGGSSTYSMEICVKGPDGKYVARKPVDDEGLAFVSIQRGESYAVRLYNHSPHEAAVTLTIDGLNAFSFSRVKNPKTGRPYTVYIVDPGKSALIRGWHRTQTESEEFLVTEYSKSAAAELKHTAGIGTITAVFSVCWPKGTNPPSDEPSNPKEFSRSGDATGRGVPFATNFEAVEREFGVVRSTISVRYTKAADPTDLPPA